jgi:hypothetical protein
MFSSWGNALIFQAIKNLVTNNLDKIALKFGSVLVVAINANPQAS